MPRWFRICLMVFGPMPLGFLTLWFGNLAWGVFSRLVAGSGDAIDFLLHGLADGKGFLLIFTDITKLLMFLLGLLVCSLPSLVYMACMELAISEGLDTRSWKLVALSSFLGLLTGLGLGLSFLSHEISLLIPLGAWVGFALGMIIKLMPEEIRLRRRKRH